MKPGAIELPCELADVPAGAAIKLCGAWYVVTGRANSAVMLRSLISEGDATVVTGSQLFVLPTQIKVKEARWPLRLRDERGRVADPLAP